MGKMPMLHMGCRKNSALILGFGQTDCDAFFPDFDFFDVAAAPYHQIDDFYFSPLKLFEYLAIGRPVVASAIGQLCDVIQHGTTGLLATPDDPGDFAAKVAELQRDTALRERISQSAAVEGARRTWRHNAQKMVELAADHVAAA